MTNLMQQLQAWADEGLYRFPNGDDIVSVARCFTKPVGVFQLTPEQTFGIQCVLDGTIQVWRPVEHYKPTGQVLCLTASKAKPYFVARPYQAPDSGQWVFDSVELQRVVSFTHWQPLPQPPQEVK